MRHTPEVNGASSPPLLYAGCASPLETGLFPVHARWCPRGSRKGALRDRCRRRRELAGPAVRTRTAPARRPSGQDAGPTRPIECCRGPRGGREPLEKPPSLAPRTSEGSACGRRTPPLTWTLPSKHCPSFTTRAAQRGHQIPPFILDTLFPLDTLLYYFCLIKASPRPDATPTVSVVCSSRHTGGECGQAEPRQRSWETPMTSSPLARRSS